MEFSHLEKYCNLQKTTKKWKVNSMSYFLAVFEPQFSKKKNFVGPWKMCLNSPFLIWVPCTSIYSQTVMYYTSFGYLNVLITYYWNSMANLYHTALCHQLYLFSDIAILLSSYPPELAYFEIRITFFACVPKICWLHAVLPTLTILKFSKWVMIKIYVKWV